MSGKHSYFCTDFGKSQSDLVNYWYSLEIFLDTGSASENGSESSGYLTTGYNLFTGREVNPSGVTLYTDGSGNTVLMNGLDDGDGTTGD